MNKIEELESICEVLPYEECAIKSREKCLERLFHPIDDSLFFDSQKNEFVEKPLQDHVLRNIGYIANKCSKKNCRKCIVSKWCNTFRESRQTAESLREAPTFADFFCGAGGLSVGFRNAGFKVSMANDIQKCCIETYRFNAPEVPTKHIVCGDINNILLRISDISRYKIVDVVVGGPPCQGFSMANRQRLIDDPRNHLYKSFIQAVDMLRPKFVVMENVKGILEYKEEIYKDYENIGYKAKAYILNAYDFGVPQNRYRTFFIANRMNIDNDLIYSDLIKLSRKQKKTNLGEAINDLPELKARSIKNKYDDNERSGRTISFCPRGENEYLNLINKGDPYSSLLFNHKARFNNKRDIEIYSRLLPGDDSTDEKIADIMPYSRRNAIFKDKYYKLDGNLPCKTITAHMKFDCNMYIHPSQARGLTPREAARVQSYPDNYLFVGSFTKTYMQVGNSVPPLVSKAIADVIKKYI